MDSHLEGQCLKANKLWTVISVITPRAAFEDAGAGAVDFIKMIDGYPIVLSLDEWMELEPKEGEDYISLSKKRIPVPRVVICRNYDKFRAKAVPFSLRNLAKRYNYTCAVSGEPLYDENEWSREHVVPKSKGGKSGWEHEALMKRKLNNRRGNRPYEDLGLKAPKILGAPPPLLPINMIVNKNNYPEWEMFGIRN